MSYDKKQDNEIYNVVLNMRIDQLDSLFLALDGTFLTLSVQWTQNSQNPHLSLVTSYMIIKL